jgi:hypothetical protein
MSPAADPTADAGDSAGVPWAGRTLTAQPFAGDDGSADPAVEAALAAWAAQPGSGTLGDVVRSWAQSRVMVPIVAVLGEGDDVRAAAQLGQGDKSADMALVTVTTPDGQLALPAFTSTAALAAWNPDARPVPVEAARAAQAGVVEGCDVVVIDPAGPVPCLLPRPAVWAVAQGRDWLPPAEDPQVLDAVAAVVEAVAEVAAHRCEPAGAAGLVVVLGLPAGLDPAGVQEVAARLAQLLSADAVVAERVDALQLTVRTV